MKAVERQRTECVTTVAQCKRPLGRAALGEAVPMTSRPLGRDKKLAVTYPYEEYRDWRKALFQRKTREMII